ncbi:MAG: DUF58 domain-containing protein [Defluviitaleaceae bacterium]|nr:DUF58 domain-containing protein [Defluviitaleaceae bacterium]
MKLHWLFLLALAVVGAFFLGERVFFVVAAVLLVLPIFSYAFAFLSLRLVKISYVPPRPVVKNEQGAFSIRLHNRGFLPFGKIGVILRAEQYDHLGKPKDELTLYLFYRRVVSKTFSVPYRGHFEMGIEAIYARDLTGLFKLRRQVNAFETLTVLPLVAEANNLSLAARFEGFSAYDLHAEDYSSVADIRQYLPTDSIKRVHWKLTAKRNEWLVKNYQSHGRNHAVVLLGGGALPLFSDCSFMGTPSRSLDSVLTLEDALIENTLGIVKALLTKGTSVDFICMGQKITARTAADFDIIYKAASELRFGAFDCTAAMNQIFHEAAGCVNLILVTAALDPKIYERLIYGSNHGHGMAVLFVSCESGNERGKSESNDKNSNKTDNKTESERIYTILSEGGIYCSKISV